MKPNPTLLLALAALLSLACTPHPPPGPPSPAPTDREFVDLRTRVLLKLINGQLLPGQPPLREPYAIGFDPADSQSVRDQVLAGLKTALGTLPTQAPPGPAPAGTTVLYADLYQVQGDTVLMTGSIAASGPLSGVTYILEFSRDPGGFHFNRVRDILTA
jgi:hypothetical protein